MKQRLTHLSILVVDALIVFVSLFVAFLVRVDYPLAWSSLVHMVTVYTGGVVVTVVAPVMALWLVGLHGPQAALVRPWGGAGRPLGARLVVRIGLAVALGGIALTAWYFMFPFWRIGRGTWLYTLLLAFVLLSVWRSIILRVIRSWEPAARLLLVGVGQGARELVDTVGDVEQLTIVGAVPLPGEVPDEGIAGQVPLLEVGLPLAECMEATGATMAVVTGTIGTDATLVGELLQVERGGALVTDMVSMCKETAGKLPLVHLEDAWITIRDEARRRRGGPYERASRVLDVTVSLVVLAVTAPILLLVAAAIKLSSRGPLVYTQTRVGRDGRPFTLYKLRTMRPDAEKDGAAWASPADDPRVTSVGRLLRKLRLDELPQLVNVIKGDMALVGPRPERPVFVDQLQARVPFYGVRHVVKPGVTGWAQVRYRYGKSEEEALEKLRYDLFYVREASLLFDIRVIAETAEAVLFGQGS